MKAKYLITFISVDGKVDQTEIKLGRTYSSGGFRIALREIAAMVKWPRGDNVKSVSITRSE